MNWKNVLGVVLAVVGVLVFFGILIVAVGWKTVLISVLITCAAMCWLYIVLYLLAAKD